DLGGQYQVVVLNGEGTGTGVESGRLFVNGAELFSPTELNQSNHRISHVLNSPRAVNTLRCQLFGSGSAGPREPKVTVEILLRDHTPPQLSVDPRDGVLIYQRQPLIRIDYQDAQSGIDLSSLSIMVDGQDWTPLFTVTATNATYQVDEAHALQ